MDSELNELALLALKNAFYTDFGALVNAYLKAAAGLDTRDFDAQLSETANVFSRDDEVEGDNHPIIYTTTAGGWSSGFDTLAQALAHDEALAVYLQGKKVFERRAGDWHFVGDE